MNRHHIVEGHTWSIVLAGGEGERVKPLLQQWLGEQPPKPYCAFVGSRSLFQHTVDRATRLTSASRTVAVAPRDHRTQVETQLYGRAIGKVILQPADRGTAAGLFLPLSFVRARDPKAVVVIQPSDHFVYPEERFLEVTRQSIVSARRMPERLVLLGVPPDRLETEYGWIQLGPRLNGSLWNPMHSVSSFLEQPGVAQADAALRAGSLWNTSVLAATMESLWQAGWACFPDMMPLFEQLAAAWKTHDEPTAVEAVYQEVPAYNISSQLLERRPDLVAVVELSGVLWSDWGKPERIAESIRRIGGIPAFPPACLNRPFAPHPVPQTTREVVISA